MRLASVIRWATRGAAGFLLAALVVVGPVSAGGGNGNSAVMPLNSHPHGHSYAEWSAAHWQWGLSMPVDANPQLDTADCSAGQVGKVWFLGGTFGPTLIAPGVFLGEVTRDCTIPAGTSLFFPLVDVETSTIEGNGTTEAELRDSAEFFADFIVPSTLFCTIDGKSVTNLTDYRVQSPLFVFGPLPDNNVVEVIFGAVAPEGSTSLSISDGYFVMLKPLSVGKHTIKYGGILDLSSIGGPMFIQDITYHVTVKR